MSAANVERAVAELPEQHRRVMALLALTGYTVEQVVRNDVTFQYWQLRYPSGQIAMAYMGLRSLLEYSADRVGVRIGTSI